MNDLGEVRLNIVKNSIATALCIDDEFCEPFVNNEGSQNERCRKLYNDFRNNGCLLDIHRFNDKYDEAKISKHLKNKDLLILDWELSESEPKYLKSLEILEQAVNSDNILFVCIYTHSQDIDMHIIPQLYAYFSNVNMEDMDYIYNGICDELEEVYNGIDSEEFIEQLLAKCFQFLFLSTDDEKFKKQLEKSLNENDIDLKRFCGIFKKHFAKNNMVIRDFREIFKIILLYKKHYYAYSGKNKTQVALIDNEKRALFIGNTLVIINSKDIEPEVLFSNLASTITERPGNIFSLLGLETRTQYRNCALSIGKDMEGIDENAFLYFYNQVANNEAFNELMKEIWQAKVSSVLLAENSGLNKVISTKATEKRASDFKNADNFLDELLKLNAYFSSKNAKRVNNKIRFGDIFEAIDKNSGKNSRMFFICITPHCDCLDPTKISNNFYFVRGIEVTGKKNLHKALEKVEIDNYSFVRKGDEVICIEWICKMFTMYIDNEDNKIQEPIEGYFKNEKITLSYVTLQKENYTQRIANKSSSHASRVGITYSKIDENIGNCLEGQVTNKECQGIEDNINMSFN